MRDSSNCHFRRTQSTSGSGLQSKHSARLHTTEILLHIMTCNFWIKII